MQNTETKNSLNIALLTAHIGETTEENTISLTMWKSYLEKIMEWGSKFNATTVKLKQRCNNIQKI